jgi:protein gp37
MGENSKIEWTDHTFNPWIGCRSVGAECVNCYAAEWDRRLAGGRRFGEGGVRQATSVAYWGQPLRWNRAAAAAGRRATVFCGSLCDVFEREAPGPVQLDLMPLRRSLWALVRQTPYLLWLLLTKRAWDVVDLLHEDWREALPLNVAVGMSAGTQDALRTRVVPYLLGLPEGTRFLSLEPLLGPMQIAEALPDIDWVVVGGESGPNARPCQVEWVESVVQQCQRARVPVFVKQLGANAWGCGERGVPVRLPLRHRRGGDPAEWPVSVRVRQPLLGGMPALARILPDWPTGGQEGGCGGGEADCDTAQIRASEGVLGD